MKKLPKWTDVYPQGCKAGDEEQDFFIALARNPKWQWRSVAAIAKESGLSKERVEELLNKKPVQEGIVDTAKKVWKAVSDFDSSSPKYDGNTRKRQEQRKRLEAKKPVKEEKMTDEKPPFDGPYTKTPATVTDKSGAKHGPMSRARTLARDAMKKVSSGLPKKKLNESRKAEIVKQASKDAKKKTKDKEVADDKFQPQPTLDSQVIKTD